MTYRKSPHKAAARSAWNEFVTGNQPIIAATGMPDTIFSSIDHFDDFLSHGCLTHHVDPGDFRIDALSDAQYDALVTFVESYFAAGYEWFTPAALHPADRDVLASRFGSR